VIRTFLLATGLCAACAAAAAPTAFINVNVIPMTGEGSAAGQTVIVDDGRIVSIGGVDTEPVPEDAILVDGTDRYLMPGLHEMHAHVPGVGSDSLDAVLTLFAANGVTTIRGMLGRASHLALRERLREPDEFAPQLYTSGPSLTGNSVDGAAAGRRMVREQHAAGYDFVKLHPGLTRAEFEAIAGTANELGMPFAGHVPVAVGVEGALAAGMASIDHLDGYLAALVPVSAGASGGYGGFFDVLIADDVDEELVAGIVAATAASATANVPTQTLFEARVSRTPAEAMADWPEMRYVAPLMLRNWVATKQEQLAERGFETAEAARAIRIRRRLIAELYAAGATVLLGSDAPQVFNVPGFSLHRELKLYVEAGLTPWQALHTGTAAAAAFLGSDAGVVAPGRAADLVLLDADPLTDIDNTRRIHGVMLRGRWYPRADIAARLAPLAHGDD